jgi:NAD(P)-dependent dehydrogenase (short-subunit alcohol dehydrogenase family)
MAGAIMLDLVNRRSLTGKVALVTGASNGIGAAITRTLAAAGADIAASGYDRAGLRETAAAVAELGRRCLAIQADMRSKRDPAALAREALSYFGTIDVLINNTGVAPMESLGDLTLDAWEETMAVNLRAPMILAKAVAPRMVAQGRGKIINVASQVSHASIEGQAAYGVSNGGLAMLTRVMAAEWSRFNVRVHAVTPTIFSTAMSEHARRGAVGSAPIYGEAPVRSLGMPAKIADLVLFLASPRADFITGGVIAVHGNDTPSQPRASAQAGCPRQRKLA